MSTRPSCALVGWTKASCIGSGWIASRSARSISIAGPASSSAADHTTSAILQRTSPPTNAGPRPMCSLCSTTSSPATFRSLAAVTELALWGCISVPPSTVRRRTHRIRPDIAYSGRTLGSAVRRCAGCVRGLRRTQGSGQRAAARRRIAGRASPACPVQAFRVGRNVYATQFHPELDVAGICTRIEVYKDFGYFDPDTAESLKESTRHSKVIYPPAILGRRSIGSRPDRPRAPRTVRWMRLSASREVSRHRREWTGDPAPHSGSGHELLFRQGHLVIGSSSARRAVPRPHRSGPSPAGQVMDDRGVTAVATGPRSLAELSTQALVDAARSRRDSAFGTRITYSPKVFIPLTRLCRDRCGYCTFATAPRSLTAPYLSADEVLAIASAGAEAAAPRSVVHPG